MATSTKTKPNEKRAQSPNSITPANLVNTDHHDSQQDARNHRVEELIKDVEHHLVGAAEAFGEDEAVLSAAKALVPEVQGRVRKIGETAKTEDALERDADEAIKTAEQHIVNMGRAAQKKKKQEEEKKAEEEKKHGGKRKDEGETHEEKVKNRLEALKQDVAHASPEEKQKMAEGVVTPTEQTVGIAAETEARIAAAGLHDAPPVDPQVSERLDQLRGDVQNATPEQREAMAKGQVTPTAATDNSKAAREKYNQELLDKGIVPDEIHAEITRAIQHEQQKAQGNIPVAQSKEEQREAARKRISRGGRTVRQAVEVAAVVAGIKAVKPITTARPPTRTSTTSPGGQRRMMGSKAPATRPKINIGPPIRRRIIQGAGGVGAAAAAEGAQAVEFYATDAEHNDRGKYVTGHEREDPGTFLDTDSTTVESEQRPVKRGGLGVRDSEPPPPPERGGLGQFMAEQEKQHVKKMAEHAVERKAAMALAKNPLFWKVAAIIFIILLFLIIIFALIALFSKKEQDKKNQACTPPAETLTQQIIGPEQGTVGPELTYQIKIADTVPNQEVTTAVTIPPGMTFIRSDWAKFTQAANILTFKATENLPPNSLSPPNYTFSITVKPNNPNSVEIIKAVTTPGKAGATGGTTIVLDPGHGQESNVTDPATGLIDRESGNTPEREEVFEVAQKIKTQLEQKGYKVILTKASATEGMTHRKRADVANASGAVLAVSIHNDHGQPFSWSEIYTQKVGLYREANGKRVDFKDANLAAKSLEYANKIAAARAATEGRPVPLHDANFDARVGYSSGNIPLVMLFGTVPWVYNEIGAAPVGVHVPPDQIDKYAQGIANGIEQAIPVTGAAGGGNGCGGPGAGGSIPNEIRNIPFNDNTCGGKYKLTSPFKNFGDPLCDYSEDKMNQIYQKYDSANAYKWDANDDCESGNNPNAHNPNSTSGFGAFGTNQMNPEGKGNGEYDAGNVIWDRQGYNAIQYKELVLGGSWAYWACAK